MKRASWWAAFVFLLATSPVMLSQVLQSKPSPAPPSEILGPQLIAWSQMQKPQPVPEPLPPPDRPVQQSEPQTGRSAETAQDPPQQQPAAQTLSGTIVKDGSRYVLKVSSSSTYELDDQDRAKRYEGKQVKVSGTLDASGSSFHIISIELIS